jgi:hypothetical protein
MKRGHNVIDLSGRRLGRCPVCREPVMFSEDFFRLSGFVLHVRCALTARARASGGHDFRPPPA